MLRDRMIVCRAWKRALAGPPLALVLLLVIATRSVVDSQLLPGPSEGSVRAHLEAARTAQEANDYQAAAQHYQAVVELEPDNALMRQSLGVALHLSGSYPEAIRQLQEAVRLDEGLWGSHLFLGMDYYRVGRFEDALAALGRSLALNPEAVEARRWLGLACSALGRHEEAVVHHSAVLESEPHDEEALYQLARAYDNRAVQLFEQIGRSEPDSPFVHLLQAERFAFEGESERARAEYRRAVERRPGLAGTYLEGVSSPDAAMPGRQPGDRMSAIRSSFSAGRFGDAAREARAAIEAADDPSEARYWLGRSYKGLAAVTLERLAELAPDSYRADQLRAEFHLDRTQFAKALAAYERALEKRPGLPGLRYAIGTVHWRAGRLNEAMRWLEEELERNPHHTLARHRMGGILLDQGRPRDAIPHLEAAVSAGAPPAGARFDLGRAYLESGDHVSAARELESVSRAEPSNERARFFLANAYRALGRTADAARELEAYQRLNRERLRRVQRDVRSVSEDLERSRQ